MKGLLRRVNVFHVIAALLLLIWVQLGGLTSVSELLGSARYAAKSAIIDQEEPAPMSASEADWNRAFEDSMYGYGAASAASAP